MKFITELAKTYNNLDIRYIENMLKADVIYESQNVLTPIEGKENLINYLQNKFKIIKDTDNLVFAEIGYLDTEKSKLCIVLSQGNKENKGALILIKTKDNVISRIDICTVAPHWSSAIRTNEYPT